MKHQAFLLCVLICLLLFSGCRSSGEEYVFFAMDTYVTMRLPGGSETEASQAEKLLYEIEQSLSRTRSTGTTFRMNASTNGIEPSDVYFVEVLETSLAIARETDGAFSPAMGALTDLWNVNGGGPVPDADRIREAKEHTDYRAFSLIDGAAEKSDADTLLDFGAVGKGYAAGKLVEYLENHLDWGLISLGGNVGVFGEKPDGTLFKIGITNPADTASPLGYLLIDGGFVSVSGNYERYFEENGIRYHHILDPADGYPADSGLSSAAVWSRDGAMADALSTALFVMGADKALEYYDMHPDLFEAVLITEQGEILLTPGLREDGRFLYAGDSTGNSQ